MLYGDDDTQFFLDGALRLAKDFDPDLPWFITGVMHAFSYMQLLAWMCACTVVYNMHMQIILI